MFPWTTAPILAAAACVGSRVSGSSDRQIVTVRLPRCPEAGAGARPAAVSARGRLMMVRRDMDTSAPVAHVTSRHAMPGLQGRMTKDNTARRWRWKPGLVAVLMLVLMAAGLVLSYQGTKQRQRHHAERELQLVSQLQAASLRAWREQRRTDVAVLSDNNLLGMALTAWLASSEVHGERAFLQRQLQRDLRTLQEQRNYSAAYLVDLNGQVQLSASGAVYRPLPDAEAQALRTALRTAQPAFVEPRRDDAFAFPFFSMLAPVYSDMDAVGAIWLVVDVRASLYPLLERWPSGSETAESAIVTRDGNDALILNPLRHSPDTELPLRVPLTNTDNPVVEAVLGMRGVFHSRDYRGEPVIAVASTVPNSPWFLVSKIDTREAMATNWRELLALGSPIF